MPVVTVVKVSSSSHCIPSNRPLPHGHRCIHRVTDYMADTSVTARDTASLAYKTSSTASTVPTTHQLCRVYYSQAAATIDLNPARPEAFAIELQFDTPSKHKLSWRVSSHLHLHKRYNIDEQPQTRTTRMAASPPTKAHLQVREPSILPALPKRQLYRSAFSNWRLKIRPSLAFQILCIPQVARRRRIRSMS